MLNLIVHLGLYTSGLLLIVMMLMICAEVIARQGFNYSFYVVDEYSGYLLVAITFLGVSYSLRSGAMIRVDFVQNAMRPALRAWVNLIFNLLSLGYSLVLTWQFVRLVYSSYTRGVGSAFSGTPLYLPQIVMPLGMLLLVLALCSAVAYSIGEVRRAGNGAGRSGPR